MDSLPQRARLAHQLAGSAVRDLQRWSDPADPNRVAAGQAACREIGAAIRILQDTRRKLIVELNARSGDGT